MSKKSKFNQKIVKNLKTKKVKIMVKKNTSHAMFQNFNKRKIYTFYWNKNFKTKD